jgi:magnesium transporter
MTDIRAALDTRDVATMRAALAQHNEVEIAEELVRQEPVDQALLFRLLSKDQALGVFEKLEPHQQIALLDALRADEVSGVIEDLDPDDRARLLDEMPAGVAARLLDRVSPEERERTMVLLGYPAESAGRIMTPEYVSIPDYLTAHAALERVRDRATGAETIYVLYVVDATRRLAGVVSLKDLVLADPETRVSTLMTSDLVTATTDEDQEDVARRMHDNDFLAIPVVDREHRLVGIVTVDDALDILEREATEDVERFGGSEPLGRPYLSASVLGLARSRALWLMVLIAAAALTVNVLQIFEATLDRVVTLALFIPLLIGTGGNSGSQAATVVIRAMAVGEVRFRDLPLVVWREVRVGVLLGLILGGVGFVPVAVFFGGDMALIVATTLVSVCTWATFAGATLPILADRAGVDPAVVSAPLITTLVDATGLVIYFLIAQAVLGT